MSGKLKEKVQTIHLYGIASPFPCPDLLIEVN